MKAFVLYICVFLATSVSSAAVPKAANDNFRLPVPLWMGQRFQDTLNLPLFYFLAQRPDNVNIIDLGLILQGLHEKSSAIDRQLFRSPSVSILTYHILFLEEAAKAKGFRVLTPNEAHISVALADIDFRLAQDVYALETLVAEYANATSERREQIRIRGVQLRKSLVKALREGIEITGDVGTSVHDNLRAQGATIEEDPSEIIIAPHLKFPRADVPAEDLTNRLFYSLPVFLSIPEDRAKLLRVGQDSRKLWVGTEVELHFAKPWRDRLTVQGRVLGLTYSTEDLADADERLLLRDPKVWNEMQAYWLQGANAQGIVPERTIEPSTSIVLAAGCANVLAPARLTEQ